MIFFPTLSHTCKLLSCTVWEHSGFIVKKTSCKNHKTRKQSVNRLTFSPLQKNMISLRVATSLSQPGHSMVQRQRDNSTKRPDFKSQSVFYLCRVHCRFDFLKSCLSKSGHQTLSKPFTHIQINSNWPTGIQRLNISRDQIISYKGRQFHFHFFD